MSREAQYAHDGSAYSAPAVSVCDRFRDIAKQFSDRIAICDQQQRLTYAELDQESDRVASALLDRGLREEEPVALAVPKSCMQVVALLGILKAGGAYVPVVDNQPESRLRSILRDVDARLAITQKDYLDRLWDGSITPLDINALLEHDPELIAPGLGGPNLAYIMYTSGSTGATKGVMIEHEGIIRLVCDQDYIPFGPDLTYLYAAPLSFDVSTLEIFTPLLHGAKCVIVPEGMPDPDLIAALCHQEQVRSCCLAFGLFRTLFEANPSIFETMTTIAVGGERVEPRLMAQAQQRFPGTTFVNAYGPTEATMLATTYTLSYRVDPEQDSIPIGRALRGVTTHVLDEDRGLVPEGEAGELSLGGIGIARGYLNREELTKDRFVTIDLEDQPVRVYRTGDRVRADAQGNLIFLGRVDDQIKLRGHRIELGEIEQCAAQLPWVSAAVACLHEQESNPQLGMLIQSNQPNADMNQMLEHLRGHLPDAMVPSRVKTCQQLPLTRNGKVDRNAAISEVFPDEASKITMPASAGPELSTQTQRDLAGIMSIVLDTQVRFASDQFLLLGGHSLRAVVLSSRIRERFGVSLPVSQIYSLRTVSGIAEEIDSLVSSDEARTDDEIVRANETAASPLSFNQQRLWMLDRLHPNDPSYIVTTRLEHDLPLDRGAFRRAWEMLCDRQAALRTRIQLIRDEAMQVVGHQSEVEPEFIDASGIAPNEVDALIERESSRGFSLLGSPLVRCRVYDRHDSASIHIVMHHIISDAWSVKILQQELKALYESAQQNTEHELPELPVAYSDYARWERGLRDRPEYKNALARCVESLRDAPVLRLPADRPGVGASSSIGIRVEHEIEPGLMQKIRDVSNSLGVTPFGFMLAIFKVWLYRLTLEPDVVVGVPIANRDRRETEGLIGFFMETLALRDQIDHDAPIRDAIRQIAANALSGFDMRDVPFQHIVEQLGLQGQHERNPLFEVFFNYIAIPLRGQQGERVLRFSDHEIDNHTAKFDLTCYIIDDALKPRVVFNARKGRFSPRTVEWYLTLYTRLLRSSIENLGTPVSRVPLDLTPISPPYPAHVPGPRLPHDVRTAGRISDAVESTVSQHATRTAIQSGTKQLSYKELWERSGALAAILTRDGHTKGAMVCVYASDPISTCVATLACLRVGACLIPTDQLWPTDRLRSITERAGCSVLLTDHPTTADWFDGPVINNIDHHPPSHFKDPDFGPENPAYAMFTSGSTGIPKGVVQSHQAIVGHMRTFAHSISLKPGDRLLQLSSFAFDASVMDMFACWFTGATLCVQDPHTVTATEIVSDINENKIDVVHAAPTLMRWLLADLPDEMKMTSVSRVVLGGEHASDHDLDLILSHFPNCSRLVNGLGLTESSLTLQYRVNPNEFDDAPSRIPVGFPVEGVHMRLVDSQGNPCSPSGEIEIESDRIAIGYLCSDSSSLDPIGSTGIVQGCKRLRTGDLGTIRHDGSIMHIGRRDDQVQIRGCRVEPSEIALALRECPQVRDATVLALETSESDHRLVAFIECDDRSTHDSIIEHLSRLLPSYMIPEELHRVARIPRVGGGKVDRKLLIDIERIHFADQRAENHGQVDEETRTIMGAFAKVLETDDVGPDDHFFRMGGNSLRAIQLFAHLKQLFDLEIPISVIYRTPTPRRLRAEFQNRSRAHDAQNDLIELRPGNAGTHTVMLPGIGGHPLGFGPLIDQLHVSGRVLGVQYPDEHELDRIGRSLPQLAQWVIDRLDLSSGTVPDLVGYSFGGSLAIEVAMRLTGDGYKPGQLILLDAHLPYGLPRKGHLGKAWAHFSRIVEGHESSRIAYIKRRLKSRVGTNKREESDPSSNQTNLRAYRAVSRINRQMVIEYQPQSQYHAPVLLIRARQPDWLRFHRDDGHNGFSAIIDPSLVTRVEVEADHLDLFKPAPVQEIAQAVDKWLNPESS